MDINFGNENYDVEITPDEIIVALTSACNFRCSYCFQYKREIKTMSIETAKNIVNFAMSSNNGMQRVINLYGGEPTLNLEAMEAIIDRYLELKNEGYKNILHFYINTNGYIMSDKFLNILKKYVSNASFNFVLSLNGNKEFHNKDRKDSFGNETYDKIIENMKKLKQEIPNIKIFPHAVANRTFISNLYENCKSMLTNELFDRATFELEYYGTAEEYTREDILKIYETYSILKKEFPNKNIYSMFEELFKVDNYENICNCDVKICEAGNLIVCVDPNGNVLPCDYYLRMEDYSNFILCNINDDFKLKYNNKWEKYRKSNVKYILGYTECYGANDVKCSDCDINNWCSICTGMTEYYGKYLRIPDGQCKRMHLIANIFKELKLSK